MCFQLRAASDHSRGFVQTLGTEMTEKQREAIRRRLCEQTDEPCIKSEMRAVNKKDELKIGARERIHVVYCLV